MSKIEGIIEDIKKGVLIKNLNLDDELLGNKDIAKALISQNQYNFELLKSFHSNKEMVIYMLKDVASKDKIYIDSAIKYATAEIRMDKDIARLLVKTANKYKKSPLNQLDNALLKDDEFVLEALEAHPESFNFLPLNLKKKPLNILAAIKYDHNYLNNLIENQNKIDIDYLLKAIQKNYLCLDYFQEGFVENQYLKDKEVILSMEKAILKHKYINPELYNLLVNFKREVELSDMLGQDKKEKSKKVKI